MNDWLHDKKRVPLKGISIKNAMWGSELNRASKSLGRTAVVNYFLLTRLGIDNGRNMMLSAKKQRSLCFVMQKELEKYEVSAEWDKVFERDIKAILSRCDYIYKIVQENLKLTKYWPYFEAEGFDRLLDFETGVMSSEDESHLDKLIPEMEKWMAEHESEIESYLESVRPEIERHENFLANKQASIEAEKAEQKAKKKAEREEKKMIQKFERERKIKQNKWDREYETTVRHLGGWEN